MKNQKKNKSKISSKTLKIIKQDQRLPYQKGYTIWDQTIKILNKHKIEYDIEIALEIILDISHKATIDKRRPQQPIELIQFYDQIIYEYFEKYFYNGTKY